MDSREGYSFFETIQVQVATCRANANKLSKSLETVFSVDGGPLTDNVVFVSVQRVLVLKRTAALRARSRASSSQDDSPSRHPEVLLFRIWTWVSAKDGSMIWDESRRTVLHSAQRVLVLKRTAALRARSRASSSRDDSPSRHPEVLLFRIWAWVSAKDGSMIWDESRRTVLQSHQRVHCF